MDITFEFACRDDCLEKMVPSDIRAVVAERDRLRAELTALKAAHQWQPMHDFPDDQPNKEFLVKDPMDSNRVRLVQGRFLKLCGIHCFWMPLPPTDTAESGEGVSNA